MSRTGCAACSQSWEHTETTTLDAPRFFGSARTLLGMSPVSSLTRLDTLLSSSAAALRSRILDGAGCRLERATDAPLLRELHLLALALERGIPAGAAPCVSQESKSVRRCV
jgi:hypothetical protein